MRLGPFRIGELIGTGGMADVYEGFHEGQQVPVAIKTMVRAPRRDNFERRFESEVRAVAGLNHPSVVMVYDRGVLPPEAAGARPDWRAGTPYLVMELASGGSLDQVAGPIDWPELRSILLVVLDGLAHAHARGVIHRDIKPANILLSSEGDVRPGIKLSDFGIAFAGNEGRTSAHHTVGTPYYMAPEQIEGRGRDYGPWTDLYALGCVAYELVSGAPPFSDTQLMRLAYKHLREPPAPLSAKTDVPPGFEGWVRRLLCKAPRDRYRRAADAAWALQQLDAGAADARRSAVSLSLPGGRTRLRTPMTALTGSQPVHTSGGGADFLSLLQSPLHRAPALSAEPELERSLPPLPEDYERPGERPSIKLVGTGLGLYHIRQVPLVGRDAERRALWDNLRRCGDMGEARFVLLSGPAGNGKSRLVEWISERAHEVGHATVISAFHGEAADAQNALTRAMHRTLSTTGLVGDKLRERLSTLLPEPGVDGGGFLFEGLADLLSGEPKARTSPAERYATLHQYLQTLAEERPVVLWLDDVHLSEDAIGFAEHILHHGQSGAILILATARDDGLRNRHILHHRIKRLLSHPRAEALPLAGLGAEETKRLVEELLLLEPCLAEEVERRTEGNPLFAVELVGDWVERGCLEATAEGFTMRSGESAPLPADLFALWNGRLDRVFEKWGATGARAVEVAGLLGAEVEREEFYTLSRLIQLQDPAALVRDMVAHGLVRADEHTFAFVHGMLREALEQRAHQSARSVRNHGLCVEMLQRLYGRNLASVNERLGLHLAQARRPEEALQPLLLGAREARTQSRFARAHELIDVREGCLRACSIGRNNPLWGDGLVLRSWVCSNEGKQGEAWEWAEQAYTLATEHGWGQIAAQALLGMSVAARDRGELDTATELTRRALIKHESLDDKIGLAHCLQNIAVIESLRGHNALARTSIHDAMDLHVSLSNPEGQAQCALRLAEIQLRSGNLEQARRVGTDAAQQHLSLRDRRGEALAWVVVAEATRRLGDIAQAAATLDKAESQLRSVGAEVPRQARLTRGLILAHEASYEQALKCLQPLKQAYAASGEVDCIARTSCAVEVCKLKLGTQPDLASVRSDMHDTLDRELATWLRELVESAPESTREDNWHHLNNNLALFDVARVHDNK